MRNFVVVVALLFSIAVHAQEPPAAAVASAHPVATAAGMEILARGGNAFDAAVAVSATLAVVEPYSSGMGGGGFWLLHRAADGHDIMVDGRETAPRRAHAGMFLDDKGEVVKGLSLDGPLAAAIPGQPAALAHIAARYGRLPLTTTLAPAIRAAREGFIVTPRFQQAVQMRLGVLRASPAAAAVFLKNNEVPPLGHRIRQPDLAGTLSRLSSKGRAGFYEGDVARKLVRGIKAAGGIWTEQDLAAYRVKEREPVRFHYAGYRITGASPPSSGGVAVATMLNINRELLSRPGDAVQRVHYLVEAMRRAFRDRAEFLGDPDFVPVPVDRLTSEAHARQLAKTVADDKATPSDALKKAAAVTGGDHTTHFSILDHDGNRVAATLSINYSFGSGFVAPGTGVLLNDEMDDFSAKSGVPNAYGLIGDEANAIAPGKRMLSSMSPTFVEGPDRIAILGTPGGSRIITMVARAILAVADGRSAEAIVRAPRFHHQYLPDRIQYEPDALGTEQRARLEAMGHRFELASDGFGNMQVVIWNRKGNTVTAASDPRGEGSAQVEKARQHRPERGNP